MLAGWWKEAAQAAWSSSVSPLLPGPALPPRALHADPSPPFASRERPHCKACIRWATAGNIFHVLGFVRDPCNTLPLSSVYRTDAAFPLTTCLYSSSSALKYFSLLIGHSGPTAGLKCCRPLCRTWILHSRLSVFPSTFCGSQPWCLLGSCNGTQNRQKQTSVAASISLMCAWVCAQQVFLFVCFFFYGSWKQKVTVQKAVIVNVAKLEGLSSYIQCHLSATRCCHWPNCARPRLCRVWREEQSVPPYWERCRSLTAWHPGRRWAKMEGKTCW